MPTEDYFKSSFAEKKKKKKEKGKKKRKRKYHKETCFHPNFQQLMKINLSCFKLLLGRDIKIF